MMYLKAVTLGNFRCFDYLEIPLHPRLTVLVAENGGGKTAVLDGIAIGLSPVLRYFSTADQRLSGPGFLDTDFRLRPGIWTGRDERAGASDYAQIILETTTGLKWDNWRPSAHGRQPETVVGQSGLASYASGVLDSFRSDRKLLPVFAYYGARRGWIVVPERIRETRLDYSQPASALLGSLDAQSDFKEMVKWFDMEEASELRENRGMLPPFSTDAQGQQQLSIFEYRESPALSQVRAAISTILGGAYQKPQFNQRHKFVVESAAGHEMMQVSQLSQGYQSMLALAMDFARRLAIANAHLVDSSDAPGGPAEAPAIMLVDEIDLHLHPSWQQRVLGDLMNAFPGTQFIVTTHSPQVLTTVRKQNIRILSRDSDGKWAALEPGISPLAHESGDALALVMGTNPRPKSPVLSDIHEYELLARAGKGDSEAARRLKERLDKAGFEFSLADRALFDFRARRKGVSRA